MNNDIVMNNTAEVIPSVSVKVSRGEEMRRFNFKGQSFQDLKKIIAEIYNIPATDFSLQYQDDEKDRVTLSSDAELKEAIQLHKYVLRFFVVVTKPICDNNTPLPPSPHSLPPHHHRHHHHHHEHPHVMPAAEGEVMVPPPFARGRHGHGPYARPFGPYRGHGHGPHGHHKRSLDKDDKEAMKDEKKRWKKHRKCESSSSSSSSEDEVQKLQKKEMRQLMKGTKESIKANWAAIKEADPAQWPKNRERMIAEIKMAKRIIREQAGQKYTSPVVVAEQNTSIATAGAEMQA